MNFVKQNKYYIGCFGVGITYFGLLYLRRQIQGYWFDRRAIISRNVLTNNNSVIITGGNSGIGYATALKFYKMGANVVICARNETKAKNAILSIKNETGINSDNITYKIMDLNDLNSVKLCANNILNDNINIDYLILNAGIASTSDKSATKDGFDKIFQANYLGHWYFTNLLLNNIKDTSIKRYNEFGNKYGKPTRIISVSSGAHSSAYIPVNNSSQFDDMVHNKCSYGQSKLLQILHMKELQNILNNTNDFGDKIQCVSVTPGMVNTPIISKFFTNKLKLYLLSPLLWFMGRNIFMGSQVIFHACLNDKIIDGGYYSNCMMKPSKGKDNQSNNDDDIKKLWELTDELISKKVN